MLHELYIFDKWLKTGRKVDKEM